jgi:hypothetical protein
MPVLLRRCSPGEAAAMVIGERFVWAHLPKTAGMATARLFKLFPELIVFVDPEDTNDMHTPFSQRAEQIRGKQLAMNFRRLPVWVLSRAQHVARWGIYPDYKPIPIHTPEQLAESSFPDSRILLYTDEGRIRIDRWLRAESLTEDFLGFITDFTEVTEEQRRRVHDLGPVNTHDYDKDVTSWFGPDLIERMYEANPIWAELEREIYGDLYRPG